jgi:hypothetical protein
LVYWSEAEAVSVWIYSWGENLSSRLMKGRCLVHYNVRDRDSSLEIKLMDYQLTLEDGYLDMLLHLNEGFEDDLLQDCIALLQ